MAKYLDETGLKTLWAKIKKQDETTQNATIDAIEATIGQANGLASLDEKGNVPLSQLGNLDTTFMEIVTELPTKDIKRHLYLKAENSTENNTYTEYLYRGNLPIQTDTTADNYSTNKYSAENWEKLGEYKADVDLTPYALKTEALGSIGNAVATTDGVKMFTKTLAGGNTNSILIANATQDAPGVMSATDKEKLDGIEEGAGVTQNAFSNITVGSTTIEADDPTDTLTLVGSNVTLTPDATNDKITIGITKANVTSALGYTPPTKDTNTIPAICATAVGTNAKVVDYTGYVLRTGNVFPLVFAGNTYKGAITMNVNGTGAKDVYINGEKSSSTNYELSAGVYIVSYNGFYHIRKDSTLPVDVQFADEATTAEQDTKGNDLCTAIHSITIDGKNLTYTDGNGDSTTLTTQDTTYKVVTKSADGLAPTLSGSTSEFLRGDGKWASPPNDNTTYSAGTGLSLSGITFNHSNSITKGTVGTSSATSGITLAVPYVTYDAQGHITATGTHTHTIPVTEDATKDEAIPDATINALS